MKLFNLIMALTVFFASVMPCADSAAAVHVSNRVEISAGHNDSNPSDEDLCSPFCICTCCAGFAFAPTSHLIECIKPLNSLNTLLYINANIASISLPIWQPPQLVS